MFFAENGENQYFVFLTLNKKIAKVVGSMGIFDILFVTASLTSVSFFSSMWITPGLNTSFTGILGAISIVNLKIRIIICWLIVLYNVYWLTNLNVSANDFKWCISQYTLCFILNCIASNYYRNGFTVVEGLEYKVYICLCLYLFEWNWRRSLDSSSVRKVVWDI